MGKKKILGERYSLCKGSKVGITKKKTSEAKYWDQRAKCVRRDKREER